MSPEKHNPNTEMPELEFDPTISLEPKEDKSPEKDKEQTSLPEYPAELASIEYLDQEKSRIVWDKVCNFLAESPLMPNVSFEKFRNDLLRELSVQSSSELYNKLDVIMLPTKPGCYNGPNKPEIGLVLSRNYKISRGRKGTSRITPTVIRYNWNSKEWDVVDKGFVVEVDNSFKEKDIPQLLEFPDEMAKRMRLRPDFDQADLDRVKNLWDRVCSFLASPNPSREDYKTFLEEIQSEYGAKVEGSSIYIKIPKTQFTMVFHWERPTLWYEGGFRREYDPVGEIKNGDWVDILTPYFKDDAMGVEVRGVVRKSK